MYVLASSAPLLLLIYFFIFVTPSLLPIPLYLYPRGHTHFLEVPKLTFETLVVP